VNGHQLYKFASTLSIGLQAIGELLVKASAAARTILPTSK